MNTTDKEIRARLLENHANLRARVSRNGHCHVYTARERGDGGHVPWWMFAGLRDELAKDLQPRQ